MSVNLNWFVSGVGEMFVESAQNFLTSKDEARKEIYNVLKSEKLI